MPRSRPCRLLNKNLSGQALAASLLDKLCHQETDKLEEVLSALIDRTKYAFIPLEYYDLDRHVGRCAAQTRFCFSWAPRLSAPVHVLQCFNDRAGRARYHATESIERLSLHRWLPGRVEGLQQPIMMCG